MGKDNGIVRDGVKGGNQMRVQNGAAQVRLTGAAAALVAGVGIYSTTETNTGKTWIDGRTIYRKVVEFGALPNNTTKVVPHGIANLLFLVDFMFITRTAGGTFRGVPWVDNVLADALSWSMDGTNIAVDSHVDWSDHIGTVVLEYTRNV